MAEHLLELRHYSGTMKDFSRELVSWDYTSQTLFAYALAEDLHLQSIADLRRDPPRIKLAASLSAASDSLYDAANKLLALSKIQDAATPASRPKRTLERIAKEVGNFRFDAMETLLDEMRSAYGEQVGSARARGDYAIAADICAVGTCYALAATRIKESWRISKPYMLPDENGQVREPRRPG
jgi:hypothetical protein